MGSYIRCRRILFDTLFRSKKTTKKERKKMDQTENLKTLPGITHAFYNAKESENVINPVLMKQIHSADVLVISDFVTLPETDALITKKKGLKLTVKTADCAPVLLADAETGIIACVHAGWKGAFQGILETTVLTMLREGAKLEKIHAGIGPLLQMKSFEASAEMKDLFPINEQYLFIPNGNKFLFNFEEYIHRRLERAGIKSIMSVGKDTYTDHTYWSYRRDKKEIRRQFSCIELI